MVIYQKYTAENGDKRKFAYSDNFEAVPSEFKPNIDIPKCAAYLWKETSTIGKSRLYSSKLYVVEMETKFASTSLKRYFIKDKGVSASEIKKINNDLLKLASLISEEKLWRDSLEPPLPKKDSSNNKNDNNNTSILCLIHTHPYFPIISKTLFSNA